MPSSEHAMVLTLIPVVKFLMVPDLAVVACRCEVAAGRFVLSLLRVLHTSTLPLCLLSTPPIASTWPWEAIAKSSHCTPSWESSGWISHFIVPVPISKNRIDRPPHSATTLLPSDENASGCAHPGTVTSHCSMPDETFTRLTPPVLESFALSSPKRCVPIANIVPSGENAIARAPAFAFVRIKR